MEESEFWRLIENSGVGARGQADRSRRLLAELARLPAEEILAFEVLKDAALRRLDTFDLLAAHNVIMDGCGGGDGYFYFLHWVIGLGRTRYEAVLADADAVAEIPELPRPIGADRRWPDEDWPEWEELISLAARAYAQVARVEFGGYDDVRSLAHSLGDPQTHGEEWDLYDEAETARRLPGLWKLAH